MTITAIITPRGTVCPGCRTDMQGGGYVIETGKGVTGPICWWCAQAYKRIAPEPAVEQNKEIGAA